MKKGLSVFITLLMFSSSLVAQSLKIEPGDAYIKMSKEERGLHLWVKKKEGMNSILLTDSSADPQKKEDSFALRSYDYNPINGDEKRLLNGEFLSKDKELFFLIDSTSEYNDVLGAEAFHLFIPLELTYGYPWSREGQVEVRQGTWLNIRSFAKPYADYTGGFQDNPFVLSAKIKDLPAPMVFKIEEEEVPVADGAVVAQDIGRIIESLSGESVDMVLVIDTTVSMKDDVGFLRQDLIPIVKKALARFKTYRVGIVLYRDYKEAYLTREYPFQTDLEQVQRYINSIQTKGGRDFPEAVNEGLFSGISNFDWEADSRLLFQVGDAPAHDPPRGEITKELVEEEADRLGISIVRYKLPGNDPSK